MMIDDYIVAEIQNVHPFTFALYSKTKQKSVAEKSEKKFEREAN